MNEGERPPSAAGEGPAAASSAGISRLAIPTPFLVGRVNCYLIEDDPLTLVDTGPNSGKSLDVLEQALAEHGRRIEELELIVITHQHMDHLGLLEILVRRSGAEVAALHTLSPISRTSPPAQPQTTSSRRRSCAGTECRRTSRRCWEPWGRRSGHSALIDYIDSLLATREQPTAIVLPGHGEPIFDHRG